VFGRRVTKQTPGRFHHKVINRGVRPAIRVHYRASKVKQYFREGRALRTETTVDDTRDFAIGRRLTQRAAVRSAGPSASSPSHRRSAGPVSLTNTAGAPKPHVDDVAPAGEDECSGNRGA
jgi:hypothetical protein